MIQQISLLLSRLAYWLFGLMILLSLLCFTSSAYSFDIIASPSVNTVALTQNQVYAIFTGRTRFWDDGAHITVIMYSSGSDSQKQFCRQVLGMPPRKLRFSWDYVSFSGTGREPVIVETKEEMLEKVRSLPNSIGFVDSLDNLKGEWNVLEIK